MGTPAIPDLGKHCSVDDCKLIDFLPFTCDRCKKISLVKLSICRAGSTYRILRPLSSQVFCLQHRSYTSHICPNANAEDVTVLICPLCAEGVRLIPNQDPNITWDDHVNNDCDPSNYQNATKKRRCPVAGCKELLTFSNTIRCKDCNREHCLKHRFGPDHKCPGPRKPESGLIGLLRRSQTAQPNTNSSRGESSWWNSDLLLSVKASAESGIQKLSIASNQALQKAKDGIAQVNVGDGPAEQCPQCAARFSSVAALIEHVEKSHNKGSQQRRVTVDVCPKCSRAFRDPVLLVEHVEREHRGTSRA